MKDNRFLWVIVALHLGLAVAYAWVTPYREGGRLQYQAGAYAADIGAPDERQHDKYVQYLFNRLQDQDDLPFFPKFDPKDPHLYENYQYHQPPLFYLIAAATSVVAPNLTETGNLVNKRLRFLNSLIGAFGVIGIYLFVLWAFRSEAAALGAAAFAALLPMNVALSGAISNDPLLFALCSWTLALAAKGIVEGWTVKLALACGLVMGLAFLTKTTAVALWPAVALGFYLSLGRAQNSSPSTLGRGGQGGEGRRGGGKALIGILVLVLPLVIALPWWLRNQSLYGDPLAMKAFTEAFTGSPQASDYINHPLGSKFDYWVTGSNTGTGVAWWTMRSFFGAFGYMDIFLPNVIYWALLALTLILVGAHFVGLKADPKSRPVRLMGGLFLLLVVGLFIRFNSQYFQGQARYLFPALVSIAAIVGLGVPPLFKKKPIAGVYLLAALLFGLNIYVLSILPGEFEKRVSPPPVATRAIEAQQEPS